MTHETHLRSIRGFTLIELIVVIFIYSLLLAGTVDIFVQVQRAQRNVAAQEKLQDDVRFLTQTISQSFRAGGLDYSCYQGGGGVCQQSISPDQGVDILAIKNFEGKTVLFRHSTDSSECGADIQTPCIMVSDTNAVSWVRASSDGVKVDVLRFYISPQKNPYELDENNEYQSDEQPRLTLVFEGTTAVKGQKDKAKIFIQTTISSREYSR